MPSVQLGEIFKKQDHWFVRFYDQEGVRRKKGGFGAGRAGRQAAATWLQDKREEVEARRRGDWVEPVPRVQTTVREMNRLYVDGHDVDEQTKRTLRCRLRKADDTFGDRDPDTLTAAELRAWRLSISAGWRSDVFRAFRQVLEQRAVDLQQLNPARAVKNPKARRPEIEPFETWADVSAIAAELDPRYRAIPVLGAGTGLRPEEWIALERRDLDRQGATLTVERVFSGGVLKQCAKTSRQRRIVPLRQLVLDALDEQPPRLDSPLLFPAPRGGHIDIEKFRYREWAPAIEAAGFYVCPGCEADMTRLDRKTLHCEPCQTTAPSRRIYDLRHTYATWSLAAGIDLFTLSRRMGTSLAMIDQTYGHLVKNAVDAERAVLDAWDQAVGE
jgi:integrase